MGSAGFSEGKNACRKGAKSAKGDAKKNANHDFHFAFSLRSSRLCGHYFLIHGRHGYCRAEKRTLPRGGWVTWNQDINATTDWIQVAVTWEDARNDPNNLNGQVFGAISTDGGQSFSWPTTHRRR